MTSTCTAPIALKHYFQRTHTHSHTHRQTHTHTRTHTHTPYVCCLKSALCGLILSTHTHSHARTHARTRILCAACSLLSADPWRALTVHSHAALAASSSGGGGRRCPATPSCCTLVSGCVREGACVCVHGHWGTSRKLVTGWNLGG